MARFTIKIALIAIASASLLTSCDVAFDPSQGGGYGGGYLGYYNYAPLAPLPSPRPVVPLHYPQPNPRPNFRPQTNVGRPPVGNPVAGGQQAGPGNQGGFNGGANGPGTPAVPNQGRPPMK